MNEWFDAEQHVDRAQQFFEAGRWDEAESELRDALALDPYQPNWHFNLGLTLDAAGRHREAIESFATAAKLDPANAQALMMTGVNHLRLGEAEKALAWLERASSIDASLTDAYVHRIEAHAELGQHEQAEVVFYLAQQVNAKSADIYACMADSLMDRSLHEKAVWCLREAAKLDPELPGIQSRLAEAYAETGRHERARQLYLLELRRNPGDVECLLSLARLLEQMNRLPEAEEKLRRVLELEPDNTDAHFSLGELAQRAGNEAIALRHFDVVLRLDAGFATVRRRIASLLLKRGPLNDVERARELLSQETRDLDAGPDDWSAEALDELGRLLLDASLTSEARRVLGLVIAQRPDDAQAHHLYSVACLEMGDVQAGMDAARTALRLDRSLVPAMHNLALAFMRQGQYTRARYWVKQGLRHEPDDPALRRLRLRLRLQRVTGWMRPVGGRRRRA